MDEGLFPMTTSEREYSQCPKVLYTKVSDKTWVGSLLVGNILSWRFDHEIFSTVIFALPLIQEGQLSVSGKRMCTILVNHLED